MNTAPTSNIKNEENSSINQWFSGQREKKEKAQLIEASLLRGGLGSYYFYRLRYFLVRSILSALIFAVELRILIEGFGQEFFKQSLGARTVVLIFGAFWWAGLELMRTEIRECKREDRPYIIPQVILSWRNMASYLCLIIGSVGMLALGLWASLDPSTLLSAYGFYIVTLLARILVDIPLRTYHSSVYATMRIYRPIYWIVATEIVAFVMFLTLKPTIGAWSVGVASLVSLALSSSISYFYITQTYRYLGYNKSVELAKTKKIKRYRLPKIKEFCMRALPLTVFRLDAVLILLLIVGGYTMSAGGTDSGINSNSYSQLITIALCMPLLYAAQEWSMLLYFDYKKLELRVFTKLREKFNSGLKYLIPTMSVTLWLLMPILQVIAGQGWEAPPLSILTLLLTSSYLGQQSIRVFSLGSNKDLLLWGSSLLTLLSAFLLLGPDYTLHNKLFGISAIILGHAIGMNIFAKDYSQDPSKILLPPTEWLKKLKETNMPWGGLIRIVLPDMKVLDTTKFTIREAAKDLKRVFPGPLYMTNLTRTGLLFFGSGKSLIDANYPTDYDSLYKQLRKTIVPLLPETLERMIILPITIDNEEFLANLSEGETKLKACFSKNAPNVIEPRNMRTFDFKEKAEIGVSDAREIFSSAVRYHWLMDSRADLKSFNWEVASEEENGTISKIYAIPKEKKNMISPWLHAITRRNLWRTWVGQQEETKSAS
jgi:hypothetical protein